MHATDAQLCPFRLNLLKQQKKKEKKTQFKKEKRGIVGSEVDSLRKEKVAILTGIPCTSILSPSNFMHNVRENRQLKRRGKKKKAIVVAGCAKRLSRPLL